MRKFLLSFALFASFLTAIAAIPTYLQKTYTWTDSLGVERTSNLTDLATEIPQWDALVRAVYYDKTIPGSKYFIDEIERADGSGLMDTVNTIVPYCLQPNDRRWTFYSTRNDTTYSPNEHGITAFLVKLKPSFVPGTVLQASWLKIMQQIQSVSLITNSVRIESGENPGTLLNIDDDLGKFYIMTKGNPNYDWGGPPFYRMVEEYSPTRKLWDTSVTNAFPKMLRDNRYAVSHVCGSVIAIYHVFSMTPSFNATDVPIHVNMMAYIPDLRLCAAKRVTNGGKHGIQYSLTKPPYFFTYNVEQHPTAIRAHETLEHTKVVTLDWTSTLKEVTGDATSAWEEFEVLRRTRGRDVWEVVPDARIVVTQDSTVVDPNSDHLLDRAADGHVTVDIIEPMLPDNQEVEYMIEGRVKDSDFKWIQSNLQSAYIDGYDIDTEPRIRLSLTHRSTYSITDQCNAYRNVVGYKLTLREEEMPIVRGHLGGDTPTRLRLVRYTASQNDRDVDAGHLVADVTISRAATPDADGWYHYPVTGTINDEPYTATLYSRVGDNPDISLEMPLLPSRDASATIIPEGSTQTPVTGTLLSFVDEWSQSTASAADDNTYTYRIFASNLNIVDYAGGIISDTRSCTMRTLGMEAGYTSYTLEEIQSDTDHHLAPTADVLNLTLRDWPTVSSAEIYDVSDPAAPGVAGRLLRSSQTGEYTLEMPSASDPAVLTPTQRFPEKDGIYTVSAAPSQVGKELVMVTNTSDGCSYGTPRSVAPALPSLIVVNDDQRETSFEPSAGVAHVYSRWYWQLPDSLQADFQRRGFRAWASETADNFVDEAFYDGLTPSNALATSDVEMTQAPKDDDDWRCGASHYLSQPLADPATVHYLVRRYTDSPFQPNTGRNIVTEGKQYWEMSAAGDMATGVDTPAVDLPDAEWYTLQGIRIARPSTPGLYIRRQGTRVTKVRL